MPMPGPTSPVWTSAATLPSLRHSAPTPSWVFLFSPYERGYHLRAGFPTQDTRYSLSTAAFNIIDSSWYDWRTREELRPPRVISATQPLTLTGVMLASGAFPNSGSSQHASKLP